MLNPYIEAWDLREMVLKKEVRPREVAEIRLTPRFLELHTAIWQVLKAEVIRSYAQAYN